jgi:hypothetical protein
MSWEFTALGSYFHIRIAICGQIFVVIKYESCQIPETLAFLPSSEVQQCLYPFPNNQHEISLQAPNIRHVFGRIDSRWDQG